MNLHVGAGTTDVCVTEPGVYTFSGDACFKFSKRSVLRFDTSKPAAVELVVAKYTLQVYVLGVPQTMYFVIYLIDCAWCGMVWTNIACTTYLTKCTDEDDDLEMAFETTLPTLPPPPLGS